LMISELFNQLADLGAFPYISAGEVRVKTSGPVLKQAISLLQELKARKAEAITYLQSQKPFDPDQAQKLFADTLARLNEAYPYGAIQWAQAHKPELWWACLEALEGVQAAFRAKDIAAIRRATADFEQANRTLFEAYPGPFWRPGQKGTGAKVWQLTDGQARELEGLFAAPGVVERRGARWYSPEAWEKRGTGR